MSEFKDLKLTDLVASKTNPRTEFEENSLQELAESIKEHGVLQPIIVRKHLSQSKKFEIVCGERRYRASKLAGVKTIPASIRELTDDEVFEIQIIENLERKDVHPMDEAIAFGKMLASGKYTMEDIAAKIAKNLTFVAQRLKLNDLIPELQDEFLKGEFGVGHAVLFSRLTIEKQSDIFSKSTTGWNQGYGTLKKAKSDLEHENNDLDEAIFSLENENLIPYAGACTSCQKCSSVNIVLFPEYEGNFCFDSKCFRDKTESEKVNQLNKVLEENPSIILIAGWNFKAGRLEDIIKDNGKEILSQYDDYSLYGKEGEGVQAWHVDDANFVEVFLKENSKTEAIKNNPEANQNLVNEIAKVKDRAKRALELDREKIYKRTIDEIIYNAEKKQILISGDDLLLSEKIAICHSLAGYDDEWISEEFNVDKFEFRNDRLKFITENYSDQFLFKVLRKHLRKDLVSESNLDYGKNEDPAAYFNIVKDYFPQEIQLFTDEQNDVAAKRIERSNKKIKDLQKIAFSTSPEVKVLKESIIDLADSIDLNIEKALVENSPEVNYEERCSSCFRSNEDFIEEFGYPGNIVEGVCHPCRVKNKENG